jgi:hypothetical protein
MAMQHLVDLGHTKIVHLAGPQDLSTASTRVAHSSPAWRISVSGENSRTVICEEWSEAVRRACGLLDSVRVHRGPRRQRPACPRRLRRTGRARPAVPG